jgi:hypothetical protein
MTNNGSQCDLDHQRPRPAIIRLQVKSSRIGRPGHPMIRDLALCRSHMIQLRQLGVEVVDV